MKDFDNLFALNSVGILRFAKQLIQFSSYSLFYFTGWQASNRLETGMIPGYTDLQYLQTIR